MKKKLPFIIEIIIGIIFICFGYFVIDTDYYSDYYGAAEPPVRCGVSHLSGLTEPLH